uniref:Uncharacterized protein LOC111137667 isoform X2 n=1 Tax=Crassostrea virginica TaxID=6565 RepID=A0A8B8EY34_CRAVI|nr:uncharacterized protein LOC111137667 isoform X2 [Crassostrea virginica]
MFRNRSLLQYDSDGPSIGLITGVVILCLLVFGAVSVLFHRYVFRKRIREYMKTTLEFEEFEELMLHSQRERHEKLDEVVAGRDIIHGVTKLSKENVKSLAVIGIFGNSISGTSRLIALECAEWLEFETVQRPFDKLPEELKDKTIYFFYGWFGYWNDDLCSLEQVTKTLDFLAGVFSSEKPNNIKVIICMRSDLYDKYSTDLQKYEKLFENRLELTQRKRDEYGIHVDEKIKDRCKESDCGCKAITVDMLSKGKDTFIGIPLKINILTHFHELTSHYVNDRDILKVMKNHITALKEHDVYRWIKYICLKGQLSHSVFDVDLAKDIGIGEEHFDEENVYFKKYFTKNKLEKEETYVFWHPFIYICAFHSLYETEAFFVIAHCNVDAILQLLRPKDTVTSYIEISADEHHVSAFYERLKTINLHKKYDNHPLVRKAHQIGAEQIKK